jgi:small subunit ribosomal protein S17
MSQPTPTTPGRGRRRKTEIGVVKSDKMNKTRRVEIPRLVKHPKYGKYLQRRTICYAHDENNESHAGDTVEIVESRPLSRKKRWQLVRVISQSRMAGMAALPEVQAFEASADSAAAPEKTEV